MKKQLTKLALMATLGLAITFTFNACKEKEAAKNTTEPAAATQQASQEEAAVTTFTDTRDKKTYKTVKIGEQVWMAENLNYEAKDSKCYNNDPANCKKYGRLYNWETAMKACPSGWHLPGNAEWEYLWEFSGQNRRKFTATNASVDPDYNGTDDYGFSAMYGGYGWSDGDFKDIGNYGGWWTATKYLIDDAYRHDIGNSSDEGEHDLVQHKSLLYSVRCLQGEALTDTRDSKTYITVKIGEQVWMGENLNYEANDSKCYNDVPANCTDHGRLYNWETAMKACPSGWHLPSSEEWQTLVNLAGGDKKARKKLYAQLGGWGLYGADFDTVSNGGNWWSSSESVSYKDLAYGYEKSTGWGNYAKSFLHSVRCIQD